jgi:hypothetical protein
MQANAFLKNPCPALLLICSLSAPCYGWVKLDEWKKPKVFGLAPSADTAFVSANVQRVSQNSEDPSMTKTNAGVLGLYPMLHELVAGISGGGSAAEIKNIKTSKGIKSLKTRGAYFEAAMLYAFSNDVSMYFSPGYSSKESQAPAGKTQEGSATLTTYGVWAASDELGLGLGLAGRKNDRSQTIIPLIGGAWQPSPQFRLDGWLPANIHARWKYSPSQALFARLELAGDSALSKQLNSGTQTDLQLLGAHLLMGWSVGMPIGFGTGFIRLDPSLGVFKGQLTQKFSTGQAEQKVTTPVNALADVRLAVAF